MIRRLLVIAAVACCAGCPQLEGSDGLTVGMITWEPVGSSSGHPAASANSSQPVASANSSQPVASANSSQPVASASSGASSRPASSGIAVEVPEFSPVSGPDFTGFVMRPVGAAMWQPSQGEIRQLEAATPEALRRAIDDEEVPEDVDLTGYVRQYRGDLRQKQKIIRVDYFCEGKKELASRHSAVSGGGSCFLHAIYELESQTFSRWWANSPRQPVDCPL